MVTGVFLEVLNFKRCYKKKVAVLITTLRKNMKKKFISLWDRAILKKRFIIETINDKLKNTSYIEYFRHRSMHRFILNLLGWLIA
ncbi:transposase [Psychromonas sp.]|uniref:transposase n=1 Tax=Psychromonas sp. TaxID=1884585 RepID=UPI003563150B